MRFGQRGWLEDLVVTASHRRAGFGSLLLHAATDWARERGCTHLELDSARARPDAHRFYLARGLAQDSLVFGTAIRDADV
jgi:PhnO protein